MTAKPLVIHTDPDGHPGSIIRDTADSGRPLTIDPGEAVRTLESSAIHRLSNGEYNAGAKLTEEEIARSRDGIRRSAGSWRDIDGEDCKSYIAERRRASGRSPIKW
jgi:hypothetical protein